MSRWFRHYAGMMRDEKLVRVAVKAKQPVERVVWVYGAILESASEINDEGRFEFDAGEAAYFLRCDDDDLVRIVQCLDDLGRISGGVVARWSERQFNSDSAKERQRKYRERRKAGSDIQQLHNDLGQASPPVTGDGLVTSRDGGVTLQESNTETDSYAAKARDPLDGREGDLLVALGITDETKTPGLLILSEPYNWVSNGCDIDADILPALRSIAARGRLVKSWAYCSSAVFEARDRRLAPLPAIQARTSTGPPARGQTVGQQARAELKQMMEQQNATNPETRYLDASDGSPGFAGSGIARRLALASSR